MRKQQKEQILNENNIKVKHVYTLFGIIKKEM